MRKGYRRVLGAAKAAHPRRRSTAFWSRPWRGRAIEMIVGVTRDAIFGPMLMVGLGGIHVEVTARRRLFSGADRTDGEALSLLGDLKGAAVLDGLRGAPPADRTALAELIADLSRFAADHGDLIEEIDLNPVIVHPQGQGLTVVDALIVKRSPP